MQATRRQILGGLAALPLIGAVPAPRVRVVLLGTKGGPTPGPGRAAPATLIEIDGQAWVVDCGNGVANQLAKARVPLDTVARIFVTHNHSDHMADVGTLIELAWSSGLKTPVTVHGPPPIAQIVRDQLASFAYDIAGRIREEGRIPLAPLVHIDERADPGIVVRDGGTSVTSCLVDHETIKPAFAYRFDTPARSIVISGDTRYSDTLVALAKGADLLIHEAIYAPAISRMAGENAPTLADHLRRSHTSAEEVGLVAKRAGVKKLVLSHLVPGGPQVTDAMWLAAVRTNFAGEVVIGRDLMEV
ncbi:MBL fold metallo-hydrolase [Sphingomonas panacisoli]|uniref:MBL fold metallo-hydrolase n=1 Tax=Sphingomonas panacisoli TaxID=1813879 RepID=A0A5B8LL25_9SPHN|nr:MBL fold metallo-hydrolase [Sphingomonas panacisoli]QDZ08918.1 MBL fold metallo-hydrolase [Sphingomonas panacisoli]